MSFLLDGEKEELRYLVNEQRISYIIQYESSGYPAENPRDEQ
jgi:hypothetical protein